MGVFPDAARPPERPPRSAGLSVGLAGALLLGTGCAERLPDDVANYRNECVLMRVGIPVTDNDPHEGTKSVYACNAVLTELQVGARPFSDGTIIVKESTRDDSDFVWLVSTARKLNGSWQWDEYTRNFADEDLVHILAGESACIDCHRRVSMPGVDWIFTPCAVPDCMAPVAP